MNLKQLIFGGSARQAKAAAYPHSTQKWIPVQGIRDGIILTKDGRYVKVLEVMPVNFYLKSQIERQNIIYYFSSYLKTAPDNLQIKIITQKADIAGYEARMWELYEKEQVARCRELIEDNINEVRYLAANEAVTRRFFLVFGYESRMKARANTAEAIAERLREEERTARRYMDMCGLEVRDIPYADNFHLELLYSLLNRRTAAYTKLPAGVFDMVGQVFGEQGGEWAEYLGEGSLDEYAE
jgi:NADH:ubiquinone oxidoreductase subunit C